MVVLVLVLLISLVGLAYCGNGVIEDDEKCDHPDYGEMTCENLDVGYYGGTLSCTSTCQYDTSGCLMAPSQEQTGASNQNKDESSVTPPTNSSPNSNAPPSSSSPLGSSLPENNQPKIDENSLLNGYCGDGIVSNFEECDQTNLNGKDCKSFGYSDGYLLCDSTCRFDLSECSKKSGSNLEESTGSDRFEEQTSPFADKPKRILQVGLSELLLGILAVILVALCVWLVILRMRKKEEEHREILESVRKNQK